MSEQAIVDQAMESYRLAHMIIEGKFGPAVAEAIPHFKACADAWGKALRSKQRADVLLELGKLHQRLDDHRAATLSYEEAQEIYKTLGEKQLMAYAGVLAGLALKAQRRYDEAIDEVERALAVNKDGGDLTHVARTLLILAGIHMDKEQHADALARFQEAMPILVRFNKSLEISQAHELMAVCLHALGQHERAAEGFEKAIAAKQELGNLKGAAKVMSRFAELERGRGATEVALKLQGRALSIHQLRNDQALIAQTLGNIGAIHADRKEWQVAFDRFSECAKLCKAASERQAEVQALANMHLMQINLGQEDAALRSLGEALALCSSLENRALHERLLNAAVELHRRRRDSDGELDAVSAIASLREKVADQRGLAQVLDELAGLHHARKDLDKTRACLARRSELLEELDDQDGLLRALDDLAGLAVERQAWNDAADHFERGLAICRSRGIPAADLAARSYNLGLIHGQRGDHQLALDAYRSALESYSEIGNHEQAARCLRQMGACELHLPGKSPEALAHYQQALTFYEGRGDKRGIAVALVGVGNAQANLGDNAAAKAAFDRAAALKEEMGDQKGTTMIRKATSALQ
jgi:tetratricopeptide (TPR) repeat protein